MIARGNNNINAIPPYNAVYKGMVKIWPNVEPDGVYDGYTRINGIGWANTNLIADPDDETGMTSVFAPAADSYGDLYQWGRKKAWKYNGDLTGFDDTNEPGMNWVSAKDPSPAGYRVPTDSELLSLFDSGFRPVKAGVAGNAVNGGFFGANAATATMADMQGCIFIPCAGQYQNGTNPPFANRNTYGLVWTSLGAAGDTYAYRGYFASNSTTLSYNANARRYCYSVRCVKSKSPVVEAGLRKVTAGSLRLMGNGNLRFT
jgi:uncharacterized protein (TIGR02145 family)